MSNLLINYLDKSKTAYHAHDNAVKFLLKGGFTELKENEDFRLKEGGKYFVSRDGSALIAFKLGKTFSFNIVASHADSPCFKLKYNPEMKVENYYKFNVERYGGGIFYSWFDRPLTVAGRLIVSNGNTLESLTFTSQKTFVIPSVAIHFNRTVNDGIKFNAQTDLSPIADVFSNGGLDEEIKAFCGDKQLIDGDLYVVCNQSPFTNGYTDGLLSAPRIDNLASAISSLEALEKCNPQTISVCYIADNEEVGSSTKQGAGSKFLIDILSRIAKSLGKYDDFDKALANSFMVSADNAHATHPNHPEFSDPTNKVKMGEGIVIKHHANQNYTTDAFSASVIKKIFDSANVKYQDFFMRSDLPCGGTLGAISSKQVSIRSVDIGLAQLAMHSAVETMAICDYDQTVKGLTAFYNAKITADGAKKITVE
ncbi:MAG: M18 family aminopeptidase [Clostridiales bacterium]|nr:M18 family aminopeptidase [Clostridiales bacterium]